MSLCVSTEADLCVEYLVSQVYSGHSHILFANGERKTVHTYSNVLSLDMCP
jgi:hypothetical protein